ncbi:response regulator [Stenotrophomonas sp. PS02289]|uniref:response regulator n=1 Tax=Stenotrophomonas sp. PS02289 TaxID=2991422 RepID=UPI00249A1CD7|nr:response regulator [Stenotrophomonas sp. PS02289]
MSRNVLVVEDESMIAMLVEDRLVDAGHTVFVAPSVQKAMEVLRDHVIDMALLDVNLAGTSSTPVAYELEARGIPFMIATGYGAQGVDEAFRDRGCLQKPFRMSDLDQSIQRLEGEVPERADQVSARTTSSIRMM